MSINPTTKVLSDSKVLNQIQTVSSDSLSMEAKVSFKSDASVTTNTKLHPTLEKFPELKKVMEGSATLEVGAKGNPVIALQRSLITLGYDIKKVDGQFGTKGTKPIVEKFQADNGLEVTGKVDKNTLEKINSLVTKKMAQPLSFEPSYTPITIKSKSWNDAELKSAYSTFVKEHWEELKNNITETDCKGMALKFMVDFRQHYKSQTGIELPFPGSSKGMKEVKPQVFTAEKTLGWSGGLLPVSKRDDYQNYKTIKKAYPEESLIRGTNFVFSGISADIAAKRMVKDIDSRVDGKTMINNHKGLSLAEMKKTPEVDITQLKGGDVIFIDHTDDGKSWDHAVNIVDVTKREDGSVDTVKIAVSAFDDLKDRDSKTIPTFPNINFYAEEVTLKFDAKNKLISDDVTWSSEPTYINNNRYSITSTLMEIKSGGKLKVTNWAD